MERSVNETHDINLVSWVASANKEGHDFPIQNLPFACAKDTSSSEDSFVAVAIGDEALNLKKLYSLNIFSET